MAKIPTRTVSFSVLFATVFPASMCHRDLHIVGTQKIFNTCMLLVGCVALGKLVSLSGPPIALSTMKSCRPEESTFLCVEGCVLVRGGGLQDGELAKAAFSLSHQISQLKTKYC